MGLFSGITKAISSVVGGVSSVLNPLSALTGNPLVSGGLNLLGGVMSNNANSSLARQQMAFQNQQSSTSYQRAVEDLKAAGLNPMLAYGNGGASAGSGASATMQNAVGSAVSTALEARKNHAEVENLKQTNHAIQAQTKQALTQSDLNRAATVKNLADAQVSAATVPRIKSETDKNTGDPRTMIGSVLNSINKASSAVPASKKYNQSRPYGFK